LILALTGKTRVAAPLSGDAANQVLANLAEGGKTLFMQKLSAP
jgi:hypothetical protein